PWSIKPASEMCQSLRSEYSVETEKDSNYNFYVADNGGLIRREFHNLMDETPGNVYSTFEVITADGQKITFTDKDKTSEQWAKEIPQMLAYAGIEPNERMMSFSSSKEATRYVNDREKIIINERKRMNSYVQGMVERGLGFKQPGTATQVRDMLSDEQKRRAYEYSDPEKYTEIPIPKSCIKHISKKENAMVIEVESGGKKYAITFNVDGVPATTTQDQILALRMPNKTKDGKENEAYATDLETGKTMPLSMKDLQKVALGIVKNVQAAAEKNTLGNNPSPVIPK
ncbi:MAG: hypothetical protein IJM91_06760, partial [Lachnospiraceae bacterium]|nr:hypothetical protein [Lachnospiraceae bacterium]